MVGTASSVEEIRAELVLIKLKLRILAAPRNISSLERTVESCALPERTVESCALPRSRMVSRSVGAMQQAETTSSRK